MTEPDETLSMTLICRRVGHWSLNAYVLIDPVSRRSVLIDPGASPDSLLEMLAESTPVAILVTHGHPDHIDALPAMRERLKVPVLAHCLAAEQESGIHPDRPLEDGDRIAVGRHRLRVIHAPGHTPDQICFAIEQDHRIIVGDTIFKGGPGRTWSAADFQTTLTTLRTVVLSWPDDTWCYPGHGLSFNLGGERAAIQRFLSKDHGRFFGNATWDMDE
jgi:glyoxylase-like metal-dependent hydrolase (beta-lactamase superfamily II)